MSGRFQFRPRTAALLAIVAALGGCRSITARYVGAPAPGEDVGGLPIVVKAPRYLQVTYTTVTWADAAGAEVTTRTIDTDVIETGDLYALDIQRPAAGAADYGITLPKGQYYPSRISGRIRDETISDSADAFEQIAPTLRAARSDAPPSGRVKLRESVEKIEIYDLRDLARPIAAYR